MSKRVVVIGGSAAGMSAASVAKRRDPDLVVTVFEASSAISYSACGIPYRLGGEVERPMKDLVVMTPEQALTKKGVDVRTRTRVTRIDAKRKQVHTLDLERGEEDQEDYDEVVIATGSTPREAIPVSRQHGVFSLHTLDDGVALETWLEKKNPETAVVVGAGFIGVEVAEAFLARGLKVHLVTRDRHVLPRMLDRPLGETVAERMDEAGIRFIEGAHATGWIGQDGARHGTPQGDERPQESARAKGSDKGRVQSVLAGDEEVPADVVVVATGVQPESSLAREAGCHLHEDNTVATDPRLRTGVEGVWVCGDLLGLAHKVSGRSVFLPLALHANRTGRIVGMNMTGGDMIFPGVLGTAITRFRDLEIASTGLTEKLSGNLDLDVVVGDIQADNRAGYMPKASKVDVRMVAELSTGRILGVQMVGGEGTALRIDAAAAMIWNEASLEDVESMDLAYNPPFSPVWDPLAIAARMTEKKRVPSGL